MEKNKHRSMKRTVFFMRLLRALCVLLSFVVSAFAFPVGIGALEKGEERAYNWYVKRNPDHKQPTLDCHQGKIEGHNAVYVDNRYGEGAEEKVVYLTFDAGYENGNVARILDILKEEKVPAAFFVLKNIVTKHPHLIKRMDEEGHLVCNHTMTHPDTTTLTDDAFRAELEGLASLCAEKAGVKMAGFYRPPEGRYNERTLRLASELGYKTVFWSFAYADWDNDKQPSVEAAMKKILDNIHNGAILLLHPTSETNAKILPTLIATLREQGYRFASLSELAG